jgi:divalent metal cation (Fe/Co/Zn/Cd) transporter
MDDSTLRHSISLHPHPFNLSREDARRSVSHPRTPIALPSDEAVIVSGVERAADSESVTPDAERNSPPRYTPTNDPLQLASKLKTEEEIKQIRANTSRKRDRVTPSFIGDRFGITSSGKLQEFYQVQNENIERFLTPVEEHVRAAKEFNSSNQLKFKIAVWGSFAANVILSIVQVYGAVSSGSLSLFTTMADAIFDPMSNITLLLSNKAVTRVDPRKFPAGKARIETAGNICFCFLMTAVSFIIIAFSIKELADGSTEQTTPFHLTSTIAVAVAFCTKLALFLYCWALRNQFSQVRILWEDHRNDLFINGFGILTSVGGSKLRWWIDPMGAVLLSCLISFLWLRTAYSEFMLLIGVTADTQMQQLITYICKPSFPLNLHLHHDTNVRSNDPVTRHHSHRHSPRLYLWTSSCRRSRRCHGPQCHAHGHTRCRRGAANQARIVTGCRTCVRACRL